MKTEKEIRENLEMYREFMNNGVFDAPNVYPVIKALEWVLSTDEDD